MNDFFVLFISVTYLASLVLVLFFCYKYNKRKEKIKNNGEECIAAITRFNSYGIFNAETYLYNYEDYHYYKIDLLVYSEKDKKTFTTTYKLGLNKNNYSVGSLLKVKYLDNELIIGDDKELEEKDVSKDILEIIKKEFPTIVEIEGAEYKRVK